MACSSTFLTFSFLLYFVAIPGFFYSRFLKKLHILENILEGYLFIQNIPQTLFEGQGMAGTSAPTKNNIHKTNEISPYIKAENKTCISKFVSNAPAKGTNRATPVILRGNPFHSKAIQGTQK